MRTLDPETVAPDTPPPSARQLGIAMPTPTLKPLIASIGLTAIFVGLIWNKSLPIMLGGTAVFVIALYAWLLSPLEEHEE
jgi:membrane-bound ClpP family serine protease